MLPVWVYFVTSLAIALIAYAIGRVAPGLGVPFVALASTVWVAYSVNRSRKVGRTW